MKFCGLFKKLRVISLVFFALVIISGPLLALAATEAELKREADRQATLKEQLKQQRLQKERDAAYVKDQIEVVGTMISQAQNALESTENEIEKTNTEIADLAEKIKTESDNLAYAKEKLGKVIASWYMEGTDGLLTAVLAADGISDIITRQEYYDSVKQQIEIAIEKIELIKSQLFEQKVQKDQKMISLQDLQRSQESQKKTLETQKVVKDRLLNDTQKMIVELKDEEKKAAQAEQQALNELTRIILARKANWHLQKGMGQKVSAGDIIGTMGSTGNSTGAHLHFEVRTAEGVAVDPQNYLGSTFSWPTTSRRVTQEFGMTAYARAGAYGGSPHSGLDIGASTPGVWGDPIYAAGPGEIVYKDWRGAYGYAVVILHDNEMITLYAHLGTTQ